MNAGHLIYVQCICRSVKKNKNEKLGVAYYVTIYVMIVYFSVYELNYFCV